MFAFFLESDALCVAAVLPDKTSNCDLLSCVYIHKKSRSDMTVVRHRKTHGEDGQVWFFCQQSMRIWLGCAFHLISFKQSTTGISNHADISLTLTSRLYESPKDLSKHRVSKVIEVGKSTTTVFSEPFLECRCSPGHFGRCQLSACFKCKIRNI